MHADSTMNSLQGKGARPLAAALILALAAAGCAPTKKAAAPVAPQAPAASSPAVPENAPHPVMDQRALDRLKQMSDTLAAAKSFSYRTRTSAEVPAPTGQFLTLFARTEIAMERPDRVSAKTGGDIPPLRIVYDGAKVWVYDPVRNLYAAAAEPGGIEAAVQFLEEQAGIQFPAHDFLTADPYASMTRDLQSAFVAGPADVDGHPTDHLAFMGPGVNWEIWVDSDAKALPRRFAITFKEAPNFPRFLIEFFDWKLNPKLPAGEFAFNAQKGTKQIEFASELQDEFKAPAEGAGKK